MQARQDRINLDLKAFGATYEALDRYNSALTDLASMVAASNSLKGVNPAEVGASLVKAHGDLQQAVNDKSRQFQSLMSSIGDFADKAGAVEKAFSHKPTVTTPTAK
jgi:hypothetical protein